MNIILIYCSDNHSDLIETNSNEDAVIEDMANLALVPETNELSLTIPLNWDKCPTCRNDLFPYVLVNNEYEILENFQKVKIIDEIVDVVNNNPNNCNDIIKEKETKISQLEDQIRDFKILINSDYLRRLQFISVCQLKSSLPVVTFGSKYLGTCNLSWQDSGLQFAYFPKGKYAKQFYFPINLMEEVACSTYNDWPTILMFPKKTEKVPNNDIIRQFYQGNS